MTDEPCVTPARVDGCGKMDLALKVVLDSWKTGRMIQASRPPASGAAARWTSA